MSYDVFLANSWCRNRNHIAEKTHKHPRSVELSVLAGLPSFGWLLAAHFVTVRESLMTKSDAYPVCLLINSPNS